MKQGLSNLSGFDKSKFAELLLDDKSVYRIKKSD